MNSLQGVGYGLGAEEVKNYTSRDRVARQRMTHQKRPEPHYMTCGPRTRGEFLNLIMRI